MGMITEAWRNFWKTLIGAIGGIWHKCVEAFWLILSAFYVFYWGLNTTFRQVVTVTSAWIVLAASMHVVLEVVALFAHQMPGVIAAFPPTWQNFVEQSLKVPHLPTWLKIVIMIAAVLMARHQVKQVRTLVQRRPKLMLNLRALLREYAATDFNGVNDVAAASALRDLVLKTLAAFEPVLGRVCKLNVMMMCSDNLLRVRWPEQNPYDQLLVLKNGEGGAGLAYAQGDAVYIPYVAYTHGVRMTLPNQKGRQPHITYSLASNVFKRTAVEPFRSVLSVPIRTAYSEGGGASQVAGGVLNVDSPHRNAFGEAEFYMAEVAAGFLAMALDKYRSSREKLDVNPPQTKEAG